MTDAARYVYSEPAAGGRQPWYLVVEGVGTAEDRFAFYDQIEIARRQEDEPAQPGSLMIVDPTISRRHCSIRRSPEGCCLLRDTSRNGTWLDGRRLVPNIETPVRIGQTISFGQGHRFVLEGPAGSEGSARRATKADSTLHFAAPTTVTVLVGDIRDYTSLVQRVAPETLQRNVGRVFERLERAVIEHGGAVKDYAGDSIFAFWEHRQESSHAALACKTALDLDGEVRRMAGDRTVWDLDDTPLQMDWALATGCVVIHTLGEGQPTGLLMVGEAAVLAFRMEKFADASTGSVLACERTVALTGDTFEWRDLGEIDAKGFESRKRVFALMGERRGDGR